MTRHEAEVDAIRQHVLAEVMAGHIRTEHLNAEDRAWVERQLALTRKDA